MSYPNKFNAVWHVKETGFNSDHIKYYESVFTLGNGYLGTRGSFEEKLSESTPATFIAGLFDKAPDHVTELPNIANWLGIEIVIDGEKVNIKENKIVEHERILDLQSGILYRKTLLQINPNQQIEIVSRRFVSVMDVHLMGIEYNFKIIDLSTTKKHLEIYIGFDGNVTNEGRKHFSLSDYGPLERNVFYVHQKTLYSNYQVVLGCRIKLFKRNRPAT